MQYKYNAVDQPSTSNYISTSGSTSFEELLLSTMKQVASRKTIKRRVTSGATSDKAVELMKAKDNEKKNPENKNMWKK